MIIALADETPKKKSSWQQFVIISEWLKMFTDRHFPTSFLSGNPSLRDMVKDKGDFDRRLDDINKRQVERRQRQDKQDDERHVEDLFFGTLLKTTFFHKSYDRNM